MKLTDEQMGRLLFKAEHEPRRNQKRYLKDQGGTGSAEELDAMLERARKSKPAQAEFQRLERQRPIVAKSVAAGVDGQVAEMLADVRLSMKDKGVSQEELASRCGWPQPQVSAYLTGAKEPGIGNLAKMAEALSCRWRLVCDSD